MARVMPPSPPPRAPRDPQALAGLAGRVGAIELEVERVVAGAQRDAHLPGVLRPSSG